VTQAVKLDPIRDRVLVTEFLRLLPNFQYRIAYRCRQQLWERGFDKVKVNHLLLCWWKVKVLKHTFSWHKLFVSFLHTVLWGEHSLFFCEEQERYAQFTDHEIGEVDVRSSERRPATSKVGNDYSGVHQFAHWSMYFNKDGVFNDHPRFKGKEEFRGQLSLEALLPLSMFPFYEIKKESKTAQLCYLPYKLDKLEEFRSLFKNLLRKYAPEKIFVPPIESTYKVGSQKFNDNGVPKYDSEKPTTYECGFLLQSFMTGPQTLREVWLPDKQTKILNGFWMPIYQQIIENIPYYANNYPEDESLWDSIKAKLHGYAVLFDISGFGLQFIREYLKVAAEEVVSFYNLNSELTNSLGLLCKILDSVKLQDPDSYRYSYPKRGIGLGYFENLKTLCVCAILDHTDPISIFGDQGLIPFSIKNRKNHPRTLLEAHGFVFLKPEKARILPSIETGILFGGLWMTPTSFTRKKEFFSKFSGACDGRFHWERKDALNSIEFPESYNHIWRYLPFHYEIAFGYEFHRADSLNHPHDFGLGKYQAQYEKGESRFVAVRKIPKPKATFETYVHRGAFPTKRGIPLSASKDYSRKRANAYKRCSIQNTYFEEFFNPVVELKDEPLHLSKIARMTPFWQACRLLVIDGIDTGTVTSELSSQECIRALGQYPFAEDPFKVKATGGYSIKSLYYMTAGTTPEQQQLLDIVSDSEKAYGSYVWARHKKDIPLSFSWDYGVKQDRVRQVVRDLPNRISVPDIIRKPLAVPKYGQEIDNSQLLNLITAQLSEEVDESYLPTNLDSWGKEETLFSEGEVQMEIPPEEDDVDVDFFFEPDIDMTDEPEHRPQSPGLEDLTSEPSEWVL